MQRIINLIGYPQTGHCVGMCVLIVSPLALSTVYPQTGHWVGMCVLIVSPLALSTVYPQTGHCVGMCVLIVSPLALSTDGILGGNVCTYCVPPCFVHRWDTGWKCVYLLCPQTGHWWECVYLLCPQTGHWWKCVYLLCPQTGHWVGMCVLIVSPLALSTDGILGGNVCTYCVHRRDTGGNVCTYCVHPCFVHRWDTGWECLYLLCPQTGHRVGMYVLIVSTLALSTDGTLGGNVCTYCVHP